MTDEKGMAAGEVLPRRKSRLPLVMTVTMIVVVGVGVGWVTAKYLTARSNDPEVAELSLPGFSERGVPEEPKANLDQAASRPATQEDAVPAPVSASSPASGGAQPRRVVVSSYSSGQPYPLSEWVLGQALSGFIDSSRVNGVGFDPANGPPPLTGTDVIEVSGWTGDVSIGIRYPFVVISTCGQAIAHAAVNKERPDVAKTVHGNLGESGWRATIAASDLPVCENRALRAWGVAPGDRKLILPLNGRVAIGGEAVARDDTVTFVPSSLVLKPDDMAPLATEKLTVVAKVLNMRRCGDADCAVTGRLEKGVWNVIKVDDKDDWLLVALPDRAGWVSKQFVEMN